jgi:(p)ppGpp synthase/HD superfamily hydrolase
MLYTPKIQKAIKFANKVHRGQTRKGKPEEPYILHPLGVGLILSRANATEDQVTAGILHDTIEDCEPHGSITKEIIEKEFGSEVARMVNDVTEQDPTLPWDERKQLALDHIKEMKMDSIMVKSADVLHNLSDLLQDIELN